MDCRIASGALTDVEQQLHVEHEQHYIVSISFELCIEHEPYAMDVDRNGVPQYDGSSDLFEEWSERAFDLWFARAGNDSLQQATAISLRSGLRDVAYEAARKIPHKDLSQADSDGKPDIRGVKLLVDTVREVLAKEVPIRTAEVFEQVFYAPSVCDLLDA